MPDEIAGMVDAPGQLPPSISDRALFDYAMSDPHSNDDAPKPQPATATKPRAKRHKAPAQS